MFQEPFRTIKRLHQFHSFVWYWTREEPWIKKREIHSSSLRASIISTSPEQFFARGLSFIQTRFHCVSIQKLKLRRVADRETRRNQHWGSIQKNFLAIAYLLKTGRWNLVGNILERKNRQGLIQPEDVLINFKIFLIEEDFSQSLINTFP